jgi:hypothetical protein
MDKVRERIEREIGFGEFKLRRGKKVGVDWRISESIRLGLS